MKTCSSRKHACKIQDVKVIAPLPLAARHRLQRGEGRAPTMAQPSMQNEL